MREYIADVVYAIRAAYHGISEEEILWQRDLNWVERTLERVARDRGQRRRESMVDLLHTFSAAWAGGNAISAWESHLYDTMTLAEQKEYDRMEEERMKREAEERAALILKRLGAGATISQGMQTLPAEMLSSPPIDIPALPDLPPNT